MEGISSTLFFLLLMVAMIYFGSYLPNKRARQRHSALVDSIGVGDEVLTVGGIIGQVRATRDDEFEVEVAPGTVLRIGKRFIATRIDPEDEVAASSPTTEETTA